MMQRLRPNEELRCQCGGTVLGCELLLFSAGCPCHCCFNIGLQSIRGAVTFIHEFGYRSIQSRKRLSYGLCPADNPLVGNRTPIAPKFFVELHKRISRRFADIGMTCENLTHTVHTYLVPCFMTCLPLC